MRRREIYLDFAAATPLDRAVLREMEEFRRVNYANPFSTHTPGKRVKDALEGARRGVSDILGVGSQEITFTSGATEANNIAILGAVRAYQSKKKAKAHIITTRIEHSSIVESIERLEKDGIEVTRVGVTESGLIDLESFKKSLKKNTVLVSVTYVNNEIGTVQPLRKIHQAIEEFKKKNNIKDTQYPYLHTDAVQAPRVLTVRPHGLRVDLLVLDGGKNYGPKGSGVLYTKKNISLRPLTFGSGTRALRAGTENVVNAIGFAKSFLICEELRHREFERLSRLKKYFVDGLKDFSPSVSLNGSLEGSAPHIINVSFLGYSGERILIELDIRGIYVSIGSACSSYQRDSSYVVEALGKGRETATGALRFSLGRDTSKSDLDYVLGNLREVINKLSLY